MPRDNESLIDIETAARRILRYADGVDRPALEANDEKVSAILYQITIIGKPRPDLIDFAGAIVPLIQMKPIARHPGLML